MQTNFIYRSDSTDFATIYFEPYENRFGIFSYNNMDENKLNSLKWLEHYLLNNMERRFCIDLYFHNKSTDTKFDDAVFGLLKKIIQDSSEKDELYFTWVIKYYFLPENPNSWEAGVNYRSIHTNLPIKAIELNLENLKKLPFWISKSLDPFLKEKGIAR